MWLHYGWFAPIFINCEGFGKIKYVDQPKRKNTIDDDNYNQTNNINIKQKINTLCIFYGLYSMCQIAWLCTSAYNLVFFFSGICGIDPTHVYIHSMTLHVEIYQWPLLLIWFNFNPSMISNYIHYNVWDEITYPFQNFNGCTVEV